MVNIIHVALSPISMGLYDEERVNFIKPKKIVIKKRGKNDTKNQNGQI